MSNSSFNQTGTEYAEETRAGSVEEATDAEVTAGTATGSTGAKLFVTPAKLLTSPVATKFSTTEVFASGAAPTSFTDLDLSSFIGTTQKMVVLKFNASAFGAGTLYYVVRTNGDTSDTSIASAPQGTNKCGLAASTSGTVIVKTDINGVIEWKSSSSTAVSITIESYW